MNKFGTPQMRELIDGLRKRADAVHVACDDIVAADLSPALNDAADSLEAAHRYFMAVECALI